MKFAKSLIAIAATAAFGMSMTASAMPTIVGGEENEIFFQAYENWLDKDKNGFLSVGDQFYGVVSSQNIQVGGLDVWNADNVAPTIDSFSGYFLHEIKALTDTGTDIPAICPGPVLCSFDQYVVTLGASTTGDPFGIFSGAELAAGALMKLYGDNGTAFEANGTPLDDITKATDGTLWGTLGVSDSSYYWYAVTTNDINGAAGILNQIGVTFAGLDFITNNTGKLFETVNDPSENTYNTDVFLYANAELVDIRGPSNNNDATWRFQVNDPAVIKPIPEPTTLALLGLGMAGLGLSLRRRKTA